MKISTHTLVRNEERYVWYSLMSAVDHVDHMMIWDMQSTDNTFEILKEVKARYPEKVELKQTGVDDTKKFTFLRQQMLESSDADWVIILDGDEIWWDDKMSNLVSTIRTQGTHLETIVNKHVNAIGDIYHYQSEKASHYSIDGKVGSMNLRAMNRKIPGLHYDKPHGTQGIFDSANVLIQERDKRMRIHMAGISYIHFTHLPRSSSKSEDAKVAKRSMKYKYELGVPFPSDFYYPEAFFKNRPDIVPAVWDTRDRKYFFRAAIETYPKMLRRRFLKLPEGY